MRVPESVNIGTSSLFEVIDPQNSHNIINSMPAEYDTDDLEEQLRHYLASPNIFAALYLYLRMQFLLFNFASKVIWLAAAITLISIQFNLPDEDVASAIAAYSNTLGQLLYFSGTVLMAECVWKIVFLPHRGDLVNWLYGVIGYYDIRWSTTVI